jgi:ATP-binding cassette subfamily F protein 3
MPLINLQNVWMAYGAKPVLNGLSLKIEPGDRVGLVGRNGCGKTTLFHLITQRLTPDDGQIYRQGNLNIGYLSQDADLDDESTVLRSILEGFQHLLDLQTKLENAEERMASGETDDGLLRDYGQLRDRYESQGGYAVEAKAKAILFGLGFQEVDLDQTVKLLSGGQKNRLSLAQLLAKEPDLLLLDEPTNHLDLSGIEWLEGFLSSYGGAFLIVSHDRYFLDRAIRRIVDLESGLLESYSGSYAYYSEEKVRRQSQQQKAYDRQKAYIEKTEEYIRQNIAGQKTKQAKSRRKALEKIETVTRVGKERHMNLAFGSDVRGGNMVLEMSQVTKAFPDRPLFQNLNLVLRRNERLGVVGPNGCGKSTLLNVIRGKIEPDDGTVKVGQNIQKGYYDQTRQDLDPNLTVLEEIWSVTPATLLGEMRNFLGAFLFSGDEIDQKIASLSGGEQSRLALAKLMRKPMNLLILDEPTNHLDISSRMVLENALERYNGTLIVVSHDRYFLNKVVNRILILEKDEWRIVEGNYESLLQQRLRDQSVTDTEEDEKLKRKSAYRASKQVGRAAKRKKRRMSELEDKISALEAEMNRIDDELQREDLHTDWEELKRLADSRQEAQKQIDTCFLEWETIESQIAETGTH